MRMAANLTGRKEILIARALHPQKRSKVQEYCGHNLALKFIDYDPATGQLDLAQLEKAVSSETAAIYFDNPNFFGVIEAEGQAVSDLAHRHGALCIVGADPISLGVLLPPSGYGADLACGDIQSLGMHMQFGGGQAGYIACRDEARFVAEFPNRIVGVLPTKVAGEYGFGEIAFARTSFVGREQGKEWVGTMANLWAITAGVYLALMGPQGMVELGNGINQRVGYAIRSLSKIKGIEVKFPQSSHFREFLVDFSGSGKTVAQVNAALRSRGVYGGYDVGRAFPELAGHALYCVTEVHSKQDIDALAEALAEVLA
jgi:glycine dehydrogenase subunit 1